MEYKEYAAHIEKALEDTKAAWHDKFEHKTAGEALRWYYAYSEAEMMIEDGTKSLAEYLIDGFRPLPDELGAMIELMFDESDEEYRAEELLEHTEAIREFYKVEEVE